MLVPQFSGSWGAACYALRRSSLVNMVSETGFEPVTSWSQTRRATRLRYAERVLVAEATILAAETTQEGKTPLG